MAMDGHDHVLPKLPLDWNALGGVGVSGIIAVSIMIVTPYIIFPENDEDHKMLEIRTLGYYNIHACK